MIEILLNVLEALAFGLGATLTFFGLVLARELWWKDDLEGRLSHIGLCLLSLTFSQSLLWLVIA